MRWVWRIALLVVLVLVAAGMFVALTARPKLDDAKDAAAARWKVVATPLAARYTALAVLSEAVAATGDEERPVVRDVKRSLRAWERDRASGTPAAVRAANDLEGGARRLLAAIAASDRLDASKEVLAARDAFTKASIPPSSAAYNRAVADYEKEREGTVKRLVADLMGYDALPIFDST